ncbi:hypothetical protein EWB00_010393 [Schistosoma japonicum]|uniref:Uncharacterized protein n=1 Tax=Schistosoma japonicum TaxID=6182 RepID=A0A4Z2DXQ6_SCHJA|nr:hypothetical protein EWB00_010393 [Schistosoma japonicum]
MLLAYDFKICYSSTTTFGHNDVPSRLKFENEDVIIATVSLEDDIHHILQTSIHAALLSAIDIKSTTKTDNKLQTIIRHHSPVNKGSEINVAGSREYITKVCFRQRSEARNLGSAYHCSLGSCGIAGVQCH